MKIIIVDDLSGFDNSESRFSLRRRPASRIRSPDRNGVGAVVSCKRIPLGGSDADVPVNGMVNSILG